jgi:DNA polymerase-1
MQLIIFQDFRAWGKTAKKFLAEYGSMENLLAKTHELKGAIKTKIEDNKDLGLLSKRLATIL